MNATLPPELERLSWVALSRLAEPGRPGAMALHTEATRTGAAVLLSTALAGGGQRLGATIRARLDGADPWRLAEFDLAAAAAEGARAVTPVDDEWPAEALAGLAPIAETAQLEIGPPACLWVHGVDLRVLTRRAVAVVGARAATRYGIHLAEDLAYGLAEQDRTVVSGGALGVDAAALTGALSGGGRTVAVLAGGIDVPYPVVHTPLFERIVADGALVSEVPPRETPRRQRFLSRNRLVAALSSGLVVVEAGRRSGTSVTAERARQLGRPLMAVPGPVTSAMSAGTHQLIRDGHATLVTSVADILHTLRGAPAEGSAGATET